MKVKKNKCSKKSSITLFPVPFNINIINIGTKKARSTDHIGKPGMLSIRNRRGFKAYNQVISIIPAEINNNIFFIFIVVSIIKFA
jgi:hypothetical protein